MNDDELLEQARKKYQDYLVVKDRLGLDYAKSESGPMYKYFEQWDKEGMPKENSNTSPTTQKKQENVAEPKRQEEWHPNQQQLENRRRKYLMNAGLNNVEKPTLSMKADYTIAENDTNNFLDGLRNRDNKKTNQAEKPSAEKTTQQKTTQVTPQKKAETSTTNKQIQPSGDGLWQLGRGKKNTEMYSDPEGVARNIEKSEALQMAEKRKNDEREKGLAKAGEKQDLQRVPQQQFQEQKNISVPSGGSEPNNKSLWKLENVEKKDGTSNATIRPLSEVILKGGTETSRDNTSTKVITQKRTIPTTKSSSTTRSVSLGEDEKKDETASETTQSEADKAQREYMQSLADVNKYMQSFAKTPEEIEEERKRGKRKAVVNAISEGLGSIANLWSASRGANQVFNPAATLSARNLGKWEAKKKEYQQANLAAAKSNADLLGAKYKMARGKVADELAVKKAETEARIAADKSLLAWQRFGLDKNKAVEMARHNKEIEKLRMQATNAKSRKEKDEANKKIAAIQTKMYDERVRTVFARLPESVRSVAGQKIIDSFGVERHKNPELGDMQTAIQQYLYDHRNDNPKPSEYNEVLEAQKLLEQEYGYNSGNSSISPSSGGKKLGLVGTQPKKEGKKLGLK